MYQLMIVFAAAGFALAATPVVAATKNAATVPGGANQKASVEGCMNQWLFNGLWRLKVTNVADASKPFSGDPPTPGYAVSLQLRNATAKDVSLANAGVDGNGSGVELVTSGDKELQLDVGDFQQTVFKPIPQAAGITTHLHFYFPTGTTETSAKPTKFLFQVNPKSGLLRDTGLRYPIADPSFRVHLTCVG